MPTDTPAAVGRFIVAMSVTATVLVVGVSGPGPLRLLLVALLFAGGAPAALWSVGRLPSVWMFNASIVATCAAAAAATSAPGGPSFLQLLFFGVASVVGMVGWAAVIVRQLAASEESPTVRHRWALLVAPMVVLPTVLVVRAELPSRARLAVSARELDALADRVPAARVEHDALGRTSVIAADTPRIVGAYEVRRIDVGGGESSGSITVLVEGDCGWFQVCALFHRPQTNGQSDSVGRGWSVGSTDG